MSFTDELKRVARGHGARARELAGRVARLVEDGEADAGDPMRRQDIAHTARRAEYHLRQASLVGAVIARLERKQRRGSRQRAAEPE